MSDIPASDRITLKLLNEGDGWADRIQSKVREWAASGMSKAVIEERLRAALSPGGYLFESIMSGFKNSAGELVDFITVDEAHDNWTGSDEWIWIAIDDDNRCEDCSERDGEVNSWAEWQAIGLPGMGTTVCGWRCRCSLEPAELAADATLPG
jgi:hypothetical protein